MKPLALHLTLTFVESVGVEKFKQLVKTKVREAALKYLKVKQQTHTKVQNILYNKLEIQPYLKSVLFNNDETKLLFSLRTRTSESFKCNFRNLYRGQVDCPLQCWDAGEEPIEDSQQHILECKKMQIENSNVALGKVVYNDLFGEVSRQKEAITLFAELMEMKENQMKSPPGDMLDPSIGSNQCCRNTVFTDLLSCINCTSIGNK